MDHAKLIIAVIDQMRDEKGINVTELARRAHVKRKRLWAVLNGERHMRIDEFVRVCAVLNINPNSFFTQEMAHELEQSRDGLIKVRGAIPVYFPVETFNQK